MKHMMQNDLSFRDRRELLKIEKGDTTRSEEREITVDQSDMGGPWGEGTELGLGTEVILGKIGKWRQ